MQHVDVNMAFITISRNGLLRHGLDLDSRSRTAAGLTAGASATFPFFPKAKQLSGTLNQGQSQA